MNIGYSDIMLNIIITAWLGEQNLFKLSRRSCRVYLGQHYSLSMEKENSSLFFNIYSCVASLTKKSVCSNGFQMHTALIFSPSLN